MTRFHIRPIAFFLALLAMIAVSGLGAPAIAGDTGLVLQSSCDPARDASLQLVDLAGKPLADGAGFLAYKDLGNGTALAYRQNAVDVALLIEGIESADMAAPGDQRLRQDYWLAQRKVPCQYDKEIRECIGNCENPKEKCVPSEGGRPSSDEPCVCQLESES